jgi:hypothetical protein
VLKHAIVYHPDLVHSRFGGGGDGVGDHDKMVENGNNIFDLFPFVIVRVDGKEAGVILTPSLQMLTHADSAIEH